MDNTRRLSIVAAATAAVALTAAAPAGAQTAGSAAAQYSSPTSVTSVVANPRIDVVTFGTEQRDVAADVRRAVELAGLRERRLIATKRRVDALAASPLGKRLGANPEALGRAVGTQLTTATTTARQVFAALFSSRPAFSPLTIAVLSRGVDASAEEFSFVQGLARGFAAAGVTTVYVERSMVDDTKVPVFRAIQGVDTVGDVETDAGKRRLAAIIAGAAQQARTTNAATRRVRVAATPAAAVAKDGGGSGTVVVYGLVGAAVVGAGAFAATGAARPRRQD